MAAATLSESMPSRIGITARRSAVCSQRGDRPCPSEPSTSATRSSPATASSMCDGVLGQRQRDGGESGGGQAGRASYQSSSRVHGMREHRAHRDLHRPAVERVRAPRREQHGVDAERGAASGRSRRRWCGRRCPRAPATVRAPASTSSTGGQRPPLQRGQRAAVHVEAGDLLGQRLATPRSRARRSRRARRRARPATAAPSGTTAAEAGLDGPAYDLLALGQEQPVLGLEVLAQLRRHAGRGSRRAAGRRRRRSRSSLGVTLRSRTASQPDRRRRTSSSLRASRCRPAAPPARRSRPESCTAFLRCSIAASDCPERCSRSARLLWRAASW